MKRQLELSNEFRTLATPEKAERARSFFKTGVGEYSENDYFLGVRVPEVRSFAKSHDAEFSDTILEYFMASQWHEERMLALLVWVQRFAKGSESVREMILNSYVSKLEYVNNWDLVDISAPVIVGGYLQTHERGLLYTLAESENLWHRRVAVVATLTLIRAGDCMDILQLSEHLMADSHDLMHKAIGWMLREVGKKDVGVLRGFLEKHYSSMPRTMLRYAIEKFPEEERKAWLKKI